jgi:hypothetical protein
MRGIANPAAGAFPASFAAHGSASRGRDAATDPLPRIELTLNSGQEVNQ